MFYLHRPISSKRWEPIFNVRGRPAWVQTTVFDLMKELKILKLGHITLPGIDIVKIPSHRQLVVPYGDMDALCDSIEFVFEKHGELGVAYGGPDDRATLWINFYNKLAEDQGPNTQLQFVIWITSLRMPSIAFEEGVKSVYDQVGGPTRALKASLRNYQWQVPLTQVNREQSKRQNRRKGEMHPLVLNVKVALLYVVIIV